MYQEMMTIPLIAMFFYMLFYLYPKLRREVFKSKLEHIRIEFLLLKINKEISDESYLKISNTIDVKSKEIDNDTLLKWFLMNILRKLKKLKNKRRESAQNTRE